MSIIKDSCFQALDSSLVMQSTACVNVTWPTVYQPVGNGTWEPMQEKDNILAIAIAVSTKVLCP